MRSTAMAASPAWKRVCRRSTPRVRFGVPVRIECSGRCADGEGINISVGGMLVKCKGHSFLVKQYVLLTFELFGAGVVELPAQVVHSRRGEYFGVQWTELPAVIQNLLTEQTKVAPVAKRRSERVPQRLFVELKWQEGAEVRTESAETVLISTYGCLLLVRSSFQEGETVELIWREKTQSTAARVAYVEPTIDGGMTKVALEFNTEDVWGQEFPFGEEPMG